MTQLSNPKEITPHDGANGTLTRYSAANGALLGTAIQIPVQDVPALAYVSATGFACVRAASGVVPVTTATGHCLRPVLHGQHLITDSAGIVYAANGEYLTTVNVATSARALTGVVDRSKKF